MNMDLRRARAAFSLVRHEHQRAKARGDLAAAAKLVPNMIELEQRVNRLEGTNA